MTKLRAQTLVAYFDDAEKDFARRGRRVQFQDFVFPPEFTAEAVADRFGTSLSSALVKLNRMATDGILISKRAEVEGKPGKRLVFFIRSRAFPAASDASGALSSNIPGARELLYLRNSKTIELSANGDALMRGEFVLRNVSSKELAEIPLPKVRYDLYSDLSIYDHLKSMKVNGKEVPQSSDAMIHFKGKRPGKCGLGGGYYDKDDGSMHYVEIVYVVPLSTPLSPGETVDVELEAAYPKSYSNMFEFEYLSVKIREITMKAELRVVAPKGHELIPMKRYEDTQYRHGVFVIDASTEVRKEDLEAEMKPPKVTKSSIQWEIERPVMGYLYGFPFAVRKKTSR